MMRAIYRMRFAILPLYREAESAYDGISDGLVLNRNITRLAIPNLLERPMYI